MVTRPFSNFISRVIIPLSSRLSISFTRNNRCFIGGGRSDEAWKRARFPLRLFNASTGWSQFLRDLLEHVALDDVAYLVFAKISQLNSAFESRAHLFHVVLEPTQGRKPAIVHRLTTSQDTRSCRSRDATIGDETSGHDPSAQLENLFHFGVANDRFAMFRFEQARHRLFDLIE